MKILLTGASGYIGSRLLSYLVKGGHEVYILVRPGKDPSLDPALKQKVTLLHGDLLDRSSLPFFDELDAAYYLVHSMADDPKHFAQLEERSCVNFLSLIEKTGIKQIIYLSGLHQGSSLSDHFRSRLHVEKLLKNSSHNVTILRASIIIGAKSASFKIIDDLVTRLPLMITPKWLNNRCQPIAVTDVMYYLIHCLGESKVLNQTLEIGGPDVLSFKQMLLTYAKLKRLKRYILTIPVLTPRLSSYWLYLITRVNFSLASSLVEGLKVESIVKDDKIKTLLPHTCMRYEEALKKAITEN